MASEIQDIGSIKAVQCEVCKDKLSKSAVGVLCDVCKIWDHSFFCEEDEYFKTGDKSCFFCKKLRDKAGRQEIKYNRADDDDGSGVDDDKTTEAADESAKSGPNTTTEGASSEPSASDMPSGQQSEWSFYVNLFTEQDLNVKLGDCVNYGNPKEKSDNKVQKRSVLRVQFLVRDSNGTGWISGYEIAQPDYVIRQSNKRKRLQPVVPEFGNKIFGDRLHLQGSDAFIPLSAVHSLCCGLGLCDIEYGKPRRMAKKDVFSVGNYYDKESGLIAPCFPDFQPCKDAAVWEDFEDKQQETIKVIFETPPALANGDAPKALCPILSPTLDVSNIALTPANQDKSRSRRLSWADKGPTPQKLVHVRLFESDKKKNKPIKDQSSTSTATSSKSTNRKGQKKQ